MVRDEVYCHSFMVDLVGCFDLAGGSVSSRYQGCADGPMGDVRGRHGGGVDV